MWCAAVLGLVALPITLWLYDRRPSDSPSDGPSGASEPVESTPTTPGDGPSTGDIPLVTAASSSSDRSPDCVTKIHELPQKPTAPGTLPATLLEDVVGTGVHIREPALGRKHLNNTMPAPAAELSIRGKDYLTDSKKVPAQEPMFELVGVDTFSVDKLMAHVSPWHASVVQQVRRRASVVGLPCPRMLIINWMAPGSPAHNHVHYFAEKPFTPVTADDRMFKKMLDHFMAEGNDDFRRKRFKFIPRVVEGPWVVKQAAGGKPVLLGKKIQMHCHVGEGYLELSIDLSSNPIANKVLGLTKGYSKALVIDMAYAIEGKKEEELPERLLGCIRLHHIDMEKVAAGPKHPIPVVEDGRSRGLTI